MKKLIIECIVFLVIYFCILEIGSNLGGNKGLKYSWDKLKKNDGDNVILEKIFRDVFRVVFCFGLCVLVIHFTKEYITVKFIVAFLLELISTIILIRDIKKYKNKSKK